MADDGLVPIGTFARAARLTVKALRHYHAVGVLEPAWVDPATGYRHYRWEQLADSLCIGVLRDLDVPLERIARHLVDGVPLHEVLVEERRELERRAARVRRALAVVDALAAEAAFPPVAVDIVTWADHRVLAARATAPAEALGTAVPALVADLLGRAAAVGADVEAPVVGTFPLLLEGTVPFAVHLPVDGGTDGADDEPVAGGRLARAVHVGPHEALPITYAGLLQELGRRDVPPTGPVFERYLDDPLVTDPALLRTEVLHRLPG